MPPCSRSIFKLLRFIKSKTVFRAEPCQPQKVYAVALMIERLDDQDVVIFFKFALNVSLLSMMTLGAGGVVLTYSHLGDTVVP